MCPAYQYFQMGALNNPYEDWLLMEPGENFFSVRIDILGGNALQDTVQFEYYDSFA